MPTEESSPSPTAATHHDSVPPLDLPNSPAPETSVPSLPSILLTDDLGKVSKPLPRPDPGSAEGSTPTLSPPIPALPEILLSGDRPSAEATPTPPELPLPTPETPSVWVGAQDPHTLCVQWALPSQTLDSDPTHGKEAGVHLRIVAETPAPQCVAEERLNPNTPIAFVSVPNAGVPYHAEIGTRSSSGEWQVLAESSPTQTPPAAPAREDGYEEAVWSQPLAAPLPTAEPSFTPRTSPQPSLDFSTDWEATPPPPAPTPTAFIPTPTPPTLQSSRQLTRLSLGSESGEIPSSLSVIGEILSEETTESQLSPTASSKIPSTSLPSSEALASTGVDSGSDQGVDGSPRKFWFRINTEVVIYGSTEPGATVTIGDQVVKVRPDGTFSFRFALPDGAYPLPVVAASADGRETIGARVELSRAMGVQGPVEVHPQCPTLQPPLPENCR